MPKTAADLGIVLPIIHMNGDTRETLLGNLSSLYTALRETDRALCQCGPNGRNYYPVPGLMEKAVAQHRRRQATLAALIAEIEAEAIALDRGE
jgi:hypothetical protein